MARPKRSQTQIITDKIIKLDESIAKYQSKLDELLAQKTDLENQLAEIEEAERKAAEEAKMKEIMRFMDKHDLTIEKLEDMMNKPVIEAPEENEAIEESETTEEVEEVEE